MPAFKVTEPPHWVTSEPIFTFGTGLIVTDALEAAVPPSAAVTVTE